MFLKKSLYLTDLVSTCLNHFDLNGAYRFLKAQRGRFCLSLHESRWQLAGETDLKAWFQ